MNHIKDLFTNNTNYQSFLNTINESKMDIQIKGEQNSYTYTIHKGEDVPVYLECLHYDNEIEITYMAIKEKLSHFFASTDLFEQAIIQQLKAYLYAIENMENKNEQAKIYQHDFSAVKQLSNMLQVLYSRIYLIEKTMTFLEVNSDDMDIIFADVKRNYIYCLNHKFKTINELNVFAQMYWNNCMNSMKKYHNFSYFRNAINEYSIGSK